LQLLVLRQSPLPSGAVQVSPMARPKIMRASDAGLAETTGETASRIAESRFVVFIVGGQLPEDKNAVSIYIPAAYFRTSAGWPYGILHSSFIAIYNRYTYGICIFADHRKLRNNCGEAEVAHPKQNQAASSDITRSCPMSPPKKLRQCVQAAIK